MDILQRQFDGAIKELIDTAKTEDDLKIISETIFEKQVTLFDELPESILHSIKKNAFEMGLADRRNQHNQFVERNYERWKEGFDTLELLVEVCVEAGSSTNERLRPNAVITEDILFDVLTRLHAKGCLISREIVCLLKNGFPDGAHARWRALHEIAVTALFLAKNDKDTAERYVSHEIIDSYKGACQHKKYEHRLQAAPPTDDDLSTLKIQYEAAIKRFGVDFGNAYGWAEPALGKKRANFADIESAVNLDHWRPYYKWASQNIHAGVKTIKSSLGLLDSKKALLSGSSDLGMVDPAHAMAISLAQTTIMLLAKSPNIDSIVTMKMIQLLCDETGDIFLKCSRKSE